MADPQKKEPTAAEAMMFFSIVKYTRNKADVDWESVATECGFKSAEVAKVRFGQVKRKLGISSDPNGAATPRTPNKKATTGDKGGTPTKVAKTPRSKGKARSKVKKEEEAQKEEEAEEEEDQKRFPSPALSASAPKTEDQDDDEFGASRQLRAEMFSTVQDPF